nr:PREDICTED: proline-rich protein PRCC [Bemisia tabaci]XP_018908376.1 PREDICTED: proline-rich protein PRCC [Bemisia tabaci]
MSLVAYEDSDEEISDEEGDEVVSSNPISKPGTKVPEKVAVNGGKVHNSQDAEEIFELDDNKIEDLDDDGPSSSASNSSLLTSLPAPKSQVPTLDLNWVDKRPKSKNQPVKILIPSLSEFEEEEPEEPVKKKIKPSSKGSGLFALLPKPKSESSSLKLVPPSVKKAQTPLIPKQVNKTLNPAPSIQKPPNKINLDYNDSDEEDAPAEKATDFFSLTAKLEAAPVPVVDILDVPDVSAPSTNGYSGPEPAQQQKPGHSNSYFAQQVANATSTNNYSQYQESTSQPSQPVASGDYIPFDSSEIELDDDALRQLCGRKDRKAASQLIDVRGDSLVMNSQEWLMQSLSEEKVQKSHKKNKKDGPSTMEKRKHQITYLAHQAKENELELKNTWANNRQTRKQTQAKYGF